MITRLLVDVPEAFHTIDWLLVSLFFGIISPHSFMVDCDIMFSGVRTQPGRSVRRDIGIGICHPLEISFLNIDCNKFD